MFVSGRFGLKAYDITVPTAPKLLDWLGDGVNDPFLEDGNPGDGSQAPRRGTLDDMWENEDMDVDQNRKLVFLSRDPRAYGGSTGNPASRSGIYVIDVRDPENLRVITFVETPTGHTTTCINDCRWLWTGGPAPNTDQQALGWAGRPIFVTDMRDPHHPKVYNDPIDLEPQRRPDRLLARRPGRRRGRGLGVRPRRRPRVLDERSPLRPGPRRVRGSRPRGARFRTAAAGSRRRCSRPGRARGSCTTRSARSATTPRIRPTAT